MYVVAKAGEVIDVTSGLGVSLYVYFMLLFNSVGQFSCILKIGALISVSNSVL